MTIVSPDHAGTAEQERRRAATHSVGVVSTHARVQWSHRALVDDVDLEDAWADAAPVHYPSSHRGAVARYHRPGDVVILARQGAIVTVIELMDRPFRERIYVRRQVIQE